MRKKKVKVESVKTEKAAPVLAAKKEITPKAPLINSVFNLARQS
jgi:Rrf2 family iron-sulfur cluster assembly transcriptional regulator